MALDSTTEKIIAQLKDYQPGTTINTIAAGFVDEVEGESVRVILKDSQDNPSRFYFSKTYLEQRGLNDNPKNRFLNLVEYTSKSGMRKLEIVKLTSSQT